MINNCKDRNRCVKILRFDKCGKTLFGLCEPVEPQDPQSTNLLKPFYKRELHLFRLNLYGQSSVDVCRKFIVRPCESSSKMKLRDLAYGSTEDASKFGIIYSCEPSRSNSYDSTGSATKLLRFFLLMDVENGCTSKIYKFDQSKTNKNKRSRLKLFHLSDGVGWILVDIEFDTESLMGSSCEFLTFYKMRLDDETGQIVLRELMTYSAEQYYVSLTVVGSKIYIFQSKDVNVYDAAADAFCSSVHLPVYSNHIFKIEEKLYLLPQVWQETSRSSKDTPKNLLVFEGKQWKETDLIIDHRSIKNSDQNKNDPKPLAANSSSSKEVFVLGSKTGFVLLHYSSHLTAPAMIGKMMKENEQERRGSRHKNGNDAVVEQFF
uniref:Uncharacterized protein n=1 Tax=Romanomermis culicivorax TaxID=13658 RepID=A0A915JEE4_ROMCU